MTDQPNIILTGFMGTGKSTIGKRLALILGYQFVDTDALIEARQGMAVHQIFAQMGEPAFREMEHQVARDLSRHQGRVIATGGRLMLDARNAERLARSGYVFTLTATAEEIYERIRRPDQTRRPLLETPDPLSRIVALLAERAQGYARFQQISTSGRTPQEVIGHILKLTELKQS